MRYEYKVVPAPAKPRKAPRIKGAEAKFAHGLEATMNEYAADGWEYLRADILPSEERRAFRSSQMVYRTVLVFRRPIADVQETAQLKAEPGMEAPVAQAVPETESEAEDAPARRTRFSLVGPARRGKEGNAPPVSAPTPRDTSQDEEDAPDDKR